MNELVATTFYPIDKFPTAPFEPRSGYFKSLIYNHTTHLWTQRNLPTNPEDARKRYVSRHLFAQLVDKYCIDYGPSKLCCDDFRHQNILVDSRTLRITVVLDLEFTNAMPAQYSYEPPWWLLLAGQDSYPSKAGQWENLWRPTSHAWNSSCTMQWTERAAPFC